MAKEQLLEIKVIPKASRERVEQVPDGSLRVYVTVAPDKGKANTAVINLLSDHFAVAKHCIEIVRGESSRHKQIRVYPAHRGGVQ